MTRPGSIDRLSPELRARVREMLDDPDVTQRDIAATLRAEGHPVSKSSVNRYAKRMERWASRNAQAREVAAAYLETLGPDAGNQLGEVVIHHLRTLVFDLMIETQDLDVDDEERGEKLLRIITGVSKSLDHIERASTLNDERRRKLRLETVREAAEAAGAAARKEGLGPDTIAAIEEHVLGIGSAA